MFIGHFAAAFASKKIDQRPSLGTTFMAAQWLDLLWPLFLLTGTEKAEINHDPGAIIPILFTDYPVSHSLLAVVGWALLFGGVYSIIKRNFKTSVLLGLLVVSHWVLDWMVHIPDLPLTPFSDAKAGLGWWQFKYAALAFELILFIASVMIYFRSPAQGNTGGKIALWSLILFLIVIQLMNAFGPPPDEIQPVAYVGLSQWLIVFWGYWVDRRKALQVAVLPEVGASKPK